MKKVDAFGCALVVMWSGAAVNAAIHRNWEWVPIWLAGAVYFGIKTMQEE